VSAGPFGQGRSASAFGLRARWSIVPVLGRVGAL